MAQACPFGILGNGPVIIGAQDALPGGESVDEFQIGIGAPLPDLVTDHGNCCAMIQRAG